MKLTAAEVRRAGRTAREWNLEASRVELDTDDDSLDFQFSLSSKGGGITDVKVSIGLGDFGAVISAMFEANRGRAMHEVAAALATEIAKQPEHDKRLARQARDSVVGAANEAYQSAPTGRDHAERLVLEVVRQHVDQLNKSAESEATEESDAA
jgi:hypothetical protein